MKILAIVPTHDRLEFLPDALASLKRQTHPADKIIVTGNVGPGIITDKPIDFRLNEAVESGDCDAFFILCDDDMLEPTFIEKTASVMEKTGVDIVYTDRREFGSYDFHNASGIMKIIYAILLFIHAVLFKRIVRAKAWTEKNIDHDTVPFITALCKKSAWRAAEKFDSVPFFDWHFWWKCFYAGATASHIPEPLFLYRRSPGQGGNHMDHRTTRKEVLALHKTIKSKRNNNEQASGKRVDGDVE